MAMLYGKGVVLEEKIRRGVDARGGNSGRFFDFAQDDALG
jgi:hypothetical protein